MAPLLKGVEVAFTKRHTSNFNAIQRQGGKVLPGALTARLDAAVCQ